MKKLKLTLIKSTAKCLRAHKACVQGLGLKRLNQSVTISETPEHLGMIKKIQYLLKIENV